MSAVIVCAEKLSASGLPPASQHPFDQLRHVAKDKRVEAAANIYKSTCRKIAAKAAMQNLDGLTDIAVGLNDKALQCSVYQLRADYYSVNTGFNPLSTAYYQKAIDFAVNNSLPVETGIYQNKKAVYYFIYKHNVNACKYFLDGMETFRCVGFDKVPQVSLYLTQVGNFYYTLGDYENAMPYLKQSLQYPILNNRVRINTVNTLGLIHRNNKNFDKALVCFNSALNLSKQNHDTAWIAITTGNIGSVAFMQNQFARALPDVTVDYLLSLKYGENLNAAIALLRLVKINLDSGKLLQAEKQLKEAELLMRRMTDTLRVSTTFYNLKAQLAEMQGNLTASLFYHKKMESDKDRVAQSNNIAAVERVKLSFESARNQLQLNALKTEAKLGSFKRNTIIVVLFLLTVISLLLYDQRLLKEKKDKELLLSQKRLVDEALKNAVSELLMYTESLKQKNKLIEDFKTQVATFEDRFNHQEDDEHLERLLQAHIMTDENWDEFKNLFTKVYTGFFQSLKQAFPNLSNTDTRIISLLKLQLSNREMANMLGITIEGIKKSKQRLRKKMNLTADDDLEKIIATF